MSNWSLKQLETFVWVARLGSFRATAERLNTTQPNVSVRISQLEAVLGDRLFNRNSGAVTLTPRGHALLGQAERVLLAAEELSQQWASADRQIDILRLGVSELIAQTWLRDYLLDLRQAFPNVDVELKVDLTFNLREDLVARTLDLCLLNGPISNFNISNLGLGSVPYVWTASPKLADASGDLGMLASHPILSQARTTRQFVELSAHFRTLWEKPVRIVPVSSLPVCLQMTLDGMGIAPLPRTIVEKPLAEEALVELPYGWKPSPLGFTASYANTPENPLLSRSAELAMERAARHG
ncbi:LysR family transcriptional regulator [Paracoccus sp. Z118]|uniref:LysR family transcriptional regulator n=1 Tax=Paracoccus sp. Z118 TaxID=2851017 RepID=UPI001C2B83B2|nr:LysR family transcriptional regulator [Paracoccus sp. Z118]MBV0892551.1 LysR family transcriptional regulator [Paracoccus sp. Z118]